MKNKLLTLGLIWLTTVGLAQKTVYLDECFLMAMSHHALMVQKSLAAEKSDLQMSNYEKELYPSLSLQAKATYQSESISLPIEIPMIEIPELSKDQYKVTLDVYQPIYRGGTYQKQKMLESQQQILDQLNVDKTVYQVKSDVKSLFIAVVLLDEQTQVIKSYQNRLQAKCDELKAQVDEGAALATALDRLRVEMIKSDQQLEEIQIQRKAYLSNLQLLTGADFSGEIVLTVKSPEIDGTKQKRLEYDFMTATQQKLELSKKLIDAQKLPRLSAFAQGGYGRPGLNYLTNDFAGYWIVGVQFNWKIINWNQFNNQKKMNDILISSVEADKVNFERNVELALSRMRADIEKWNALLLRDPQLISLRKSVAENAGHELNQGIITTSAWVDELQQLTQAEIDMKIHEIQLINSKLDYLNIQGKL